MENQQPQQSETDARSGGIFISYPVLAGLIFLVVLIIGSAFYVSNAGSSAKSCEKVYRTERARGAEYVDVKRQFISQGWSIESDEIDSDLVTHRITFSKCR